MIELIDISYSYPGDVQALAGLNLRIEKGERLAILGPNGAGKSTLLLLLNGTLRPEQGRIVIDGQEARYNRPALKAWRETVGLVLQDPDDQLFAATVFEDVSFGPLNQGLDEAAAQKRVEDALAMMSISDLADRPTHMLSFGQRKRVALTGIVAMQPRILLLDEPSAGLDPRGVMDLISALRVISDLGTTIVLTTHDMELAYAWADRIAVFGDRRVAAIGEPETVFCDDELLKRQGIERPFIYEIGLSLRSRRLLPEGPLPRSRRALLDSLGGGQETA